MNETITLGLDDIFLFDCRKGLNCFNRCCRDINLFLTPYDIMRLKNHLGFSSRKFLDTYTTTIYMEEVGHPLVVIKMTGDEKRCPFSSPDGCRVYPDRPWSCRIFPLEPSADKDIDGKQANPMYSVVKRPFCLGFNEKNSFLEKGDTGGFSGENNLLTIRAWRERQGTAVYEDMNDLWSQVTLSERFPAGGLDKTGIQMFFLASYSLDEFAQLVCRQGFLDTYNLKGEEIRTALQDELSLFKFACKWLRVALLGEEIPLISV
ncbi:MAG: YkgJ family cysteine cluster protein [Thermodesulfobacteriota bacterium]|nr:YkgJ family cysteine cluster protein [Thermodesulfobacteriota bacterium]